MVAQNIDKGKSILRAPPSLIRKRLRTLGLKREIHKIPNRKNNISVITMEQLDILDLIAISG